MGLGSAAAGTAIGAATGAIAIGAIAGVFSGGLAIGLGALYGAQIGGLIIGTLSAAAGVLDDGDDIVITHIESIGIKNIAIQLIAVIWGLSNNGFGRGRKLSQIEIKKLEERIEEFNSLHQKSDWKTLSKNNVIIYCQEIFAFFEAIE